MWLGSAWQDEAALFCASRYFARRVKQTSPEGCEALFRPVDRRPKLPASTSGNFIHSRAFGRTQHSTTYTLLERTTGDGFVSHIFLLPSSTRILRSSSRSVSNLSHFDLHTFEKGIFLLNGRVIDKRSNDKLHA